VGGVSVPRSLTENFLVTTDPAELAGFADQDPAATDTSLHEAYVDLGPAESTDETATGDIESDDFASGQRSRRDLARRCSLHSGHFPRYFGSFC
jgi:hypothetical protein